MDWYYAEDGQQNGPVSEAQIQQLVRSGRINGATLVWTSGMSQWQAYGTLPNPPAPIAATGESEYCISCGKMQPQSEMIRYENSWVCAACKPVFFQRLKEGLAGSDRMVWRSSRAVVMSKNGILPDRCVKCNQPANGGRIGKTLYWHSPAIYACLLINVIVYIVVAMIVRQTARVEVGICDKHREQRLWFIGASWMTIFLSITLFIVSIQYEWWPLLWVAVLLFLAAVIFGLSKGRAVYASRIDKQNVWMKGFCKAYLDELPEWASYK